MATTQYVVVDQSAVTPEQYVGKVALFNADGSPYTGGDSGPVAVAWDDVTDKPAVIAAGATAAAARTAIGAGTGNGTSNLAVATTAPAALAASAAVGTGTTAARADHVHPLPTAAQVGAAAASHTHAVAQITGLQATLTDLETRLAALEAAAA